VPRRELTLSGYQGMWLFALFDLPVDTKKHRKAYARFRKSLLIEGFSMLQFSVYARYCTGEEASDAFKRRVRTQIPDDGQVRLIAITDRQFGKMEIFCGKTKHPAEQPPDQLLLF
jgi:CRISPR-associated protein Cas2